MGEPIILTGVVVSVMPIGEYDRRVVLLTRERGRITAFARGARKQTSTLLAATNTFVFAAFTLYEGRNSYTLIQAAPSHYFLELAAEMPGVYYGYYFLELADCFGQENADETQVVNLLFVTFKALLKHKLRNYMIRYIFELKLLSVNGFFAADRGECPDEAAFYALQYVAAVPVERLYSFSLKEESERDFIRIVKKYQGQCTNRHFKSLDILERIDE